MADLYGFRDITSERLEKRKEASNFFKKARNYKSYAYALKDLACECTLTDSFNCTIPLLQKADSISQLLHNKDLTADVANAFGVIYEAQEKYKNAERYFLKAIEKHTNSHIEKLEIPAIEDIFDQKIKELLFDVQDTVLKGNLEPFKKIVKDIPAHMRNDVMAALLAMCYSKRVGYNYQDIKDIHKMSNVFL